ncbi:CDP-glycerol glycerophosphotransferase family protein [Candidatus Thioglobus sp.]|nr:CDP-glycerol glycerophosphotransferase family protein [Candidatus Thioglobus sp.]
MSLVNNINKKEQCVFIYATAGFSDRVLSKSNLINFLEVKVEKIVIFSPLGDLKEYQKAFSKKNVIVEKFKEDEYKQYYKKNRFVRFLSLFRQFIHNNKYNTFIVDFFRSVFISQIKSNRKYTGKIIGFIWESMSRLFKSSLILRKLLIWVESRVLVINPHKEFFELHKPDLVIVSALSGIKYNENFAREAKSNGVKVCCLMGSWDYAVGLGMPGFEPDFISAWNEDQKNDLITLNDIDKKKVQVNGIPYWDSRYSSSEIMEKNDFFEKLKLNPEKKIILNATHPPSRFPWGPEFIEKIALAINDGILHESQILVRIHPTHYHQEEGNMRFAEILAKYEDLSKKYDHVILNIPNTQGTRPDFKFGLEENIMMNSLLKYSDVMITMFSTMQIEAALFDLPVVNYAIREMADSDDAGTRLDPQSVFKMPHVQRIIQTGGVKTALTFEELYSHTNDYLDDPSLDSRERKIIEKNFVGDFKGNASQATADYVHTILNS